jgi:thymidine phosphorylase
VDLGAGRARKEDPVDPLAGVRLNKMVGDPVSPGELLATLYASDPKRLDSAARELLDAFRFDERAPSPIALIEDRYEAGRWLQEDSGCGKRNRKGT